MKKGMNTALIGLVLTGLLAGCSDGYEMKDPDLGYDMPAPGTGSESEQTDTPVDSGQVTEDIYRVGDIYWQDADEEVSWAYMHEYCENLSGRIYGLEASDIGRVSGALPGERGAGFRLV